MLFRQVKSDSASKVKEVQCVTLLSTNQSSRAPGGRTQLLQSPKIRTPSPASKTPRPKEFILPLKSLKAKVQGPCLINSNAEGTRRTGDYCHQKI